MGLIKYLFIVVFLLFTQSVFGQYVHNSDAKYFSRQNIQSIKYSHVSGTIQYNFDSKGRIVEIRDSLTPAHSMKVQRFDTLGRQVFYCRYFWIRYNHETRRDTDMYVISKFDKNSLVVEAIFVDRMESLSASLEWITLIRHDSTYRFEKENGNLTLISLSVQKLDTIGNRFISKEFSYEIINGDTLLTWIYVDEYDRRWQTRRSYSIKPTSKFSSSSSMSDSMISSWKILHDTTYNFRFRKPKWGYSDPLDFLGPGTIGMVMIKEFGKPEDYKIRSAIRKADDLQVKYY